MAQRADMGFELGFFENLHRRMPKDVRVASILAHLYTRTGQVDDGLRMDRKLVRLTPEDPVAHYNLGCSLALKGRKADAVRAIRAAVALGYNDREWMREDPDLDGMRDYPGFVQLLEDLESGP